MNDFEPRNGDSQLAAAWAGFTERLAAYLATMTDECDHLVLETPEVDQDAGTTPYAQFCGTGDRVVRAELSGNPVLLPGFQLADAEAEALLLLGWDAPVEDECPNYSLMMEIGDAQILAARAVQGISEFFGIPHPDLLTARGWGPASTGLADLGLTLTEDIPGDVVASTVYGDLSNSAVPVRDRDHLVELVGAWLATRYERTVEQDDDGDFVIPTTHRPIYVRVRADQPVIEVFTCVVSQVRSRRQAALEIAVQNKRHLLTKLVLMERCVWLYLTLPAMPFVPAHLSGMFPVLLETLDDVRDDLALRTGGRSTA